MTATKACKDCKPGASKPRACPYPGPRCATHHRARKKELKGLSHERHVEVTYGLKRGQYAQLLEAQGLVCFICRRANGASRKLAVDHDHKSGFVRGLLCSTCNKLLGHLRDDVQLAQRIVIYLDSPPAFKEIGYVKPNE